MADRFCLWLARRLPRRLVYWTVIHAASIASTGKWSGQEVPALTVTEMLPRLREN